MSSLQDLIDKTLRPPKESSLEKSARQLAEQAKADLQKRKEKSKATSHGGVSIGEINERIQGLSLCQELEQDMLESFGDPFHDPEKFNVAEWRDHRTDSGDYLSEEVVTNPSNTAEDWAGPRLSPDHRPETRKHHFHLSPSVLQPWAALGESTDNSGPTMGELQPVMSCKPTGAAYSVSQDMINYLGKAGFPRPVDYDHIIQQWASDDWEHLVDPPPELEPAYFLICLGPQLSNVEKRTKITNATMNLQMAQVTHSKLKASESFKKASSMLTKIQWSSRYDMDIRAQLCIVDSIVANSTEHLKAVRGVMKVSEEQVICLRELMLGELKTFNNSIDRLLGTLETFTKRVEGLQARQEELPVVASKSLDSRHSSYKSSGGASVKSDQSDKSSTDRPLLAGRYRGPPKPRLSAPRP